MMLNHSSKGSAAILSVSCRHDSLNLISSGPENVMSKLVSLEKIAMVNYSHLQ